MSFCTWPVVRNLIKHPPRAGARVLMICQKINYLSWMSLLSLILVLFVSVVITVSPGVSCGKGPPPKRLAWTNLSFTTGDTCDWVMTCWESLRACRETECIQVLIHAGIMLGSISYMKRNPSTYPLIITMQRGSSSVMDALVMINSELICGFQWFVSLAVFMIIKTNRNYWVNNGFAL